MYLPLPGAEEMRVAITRLYSWKYICLPSKGLGSLLDRLPFLGDKLTVLRTGGDQRTSELLSPTRIHQRPSDCYTLTRHRTVTGEETAAIVRSPLTLTRVPWRLRPNL